MIETERRGSLELIRINRPDALNALTRDMMQGIIEAVNRAEQDPDVFAIAVTGAGRGFCAGFDTSALVETTSKGGDGREVPPLFIEFLEISKPVIAAINGPAAGAGFILAMMCDLRFMADTAFLTTSFSARGLIAEHGSSWLLPRIVGPSRALDLLWSSRRVVAEEALRIGFADRVFPPEQLLDGVALYVEHLAKTVSPHSIAVMKSQVYRHLSLGLEPAVGDIGKLVRDSLKHSDASEGARSFVERRPPNFKRWPDRA